MGGASHIVEKVYLFTKLGVEWLKALSLNADELYITDLLFTGLVGYQSLFILHKGEISYIELRKLFVLLLKAAHNLDQEFQPLLLFPFRL